MSPITERDGRYFDEQGNEYERRPLPATLGPGVFYANPGNIEAVYLRIVPPAANSEAGNSN